MQRVEGRRKVEDEANAEEKKLCGSEKPWKLRARGPAIHRRKLLAIEELKKKMMMMMKKKYKIKNKGMLRRSRTMPQGLLYPKATLEMTPIWI